MHNTLQSVKPTKVLRVKFLESEKHKVYLEFEKLTRLEGRIVTGGTASVVTIRFSGLL